MCDHLHKEKQSRDADTNNKGRETTKTNKLSCGSIHSVHESLVDVLVSFHMLQVIQHIVGLVALCAKFSCCQCTKFYSLSDLYGNSLQRFTMRKWTCEVLSLHPRRLQQTDVGCKRFTATKKNLESRTSEVLSKDGKQRVSPFYHVALHVSSFVYFLFNYHELHQESLHCHQLEEELDDWCHF